MKFLIAMKNIERYRKIDSYEKYQSYGKVKFAKLNDLKRKSLNRSISPSNFSTEVL